MSDFAIVFGLALLPALGNFSGGLLAVYLPTTKITTCKAPVEIYNTNTQLFSQWQALDHPFRGRVVDAQAPGRRAPGQLAQGEVRGQASIVSPGSG